MRRTRSRPDVELLVRTAEDSEAFAEFYRRHERSVLGFFLHWTRSPEVAADLMAETFAEAFASSDSYRRELGEPAAWLFGIARNVLARSVRRGRVDDRVRRRLGLEPLVVDDEALERVEALASRDPAVLGAFAELSDLLREAVTGRVLQEREYHELAAALTCSESVVRQRVRRGLARIRERLEVPQ